MLNHGKQVNHGKQELESLVNKLKYVHVFKPVCHEYTQAFMLSMHKSLLWYCYLVFICWVLVNNIIQRTTIATGPAKMDQVGTQILTTFLTFVAS